MKNLILTVGIITALQLLMSINYVLLIEGLNLDKPYAEELDSRADDLAASAFLVMVVAPVIEEVLFRGIFLLILFRFRINKPVTIAVIISVTFSILHPTLAIPGIFLISLLYCYLAYASKSLWMPILVHMLHNSALTVLDWNENSDTLNYYIDGYTEFLTSLGPLGATSLIFSVFITCIVICCLNLNLFKNGSIYLSQNINNTLKKSYDHFDKFCSKKA
ncbi:CPBP family intramembrane glutamic endopeptidase [Psychrobium sp. 1_MG-2023]|uniref:CPBP family intramembrane glutamic endopeptidase n=1 Tax=Psychrobium sp. 1_MG-2023 TaxID=3062624 RepID=UPI000C32131F|nr:CPBP family intramembrane glutamic endopeptidase [Psychrobium sp. 1_MG-2023]MDP2562143.1 CPBP family intramembrane metalloprotease [Psychrobium sp. 1_MG-2023]PKF57182.1 hypothetical protein CW748_07280 [Alteromonadales bacterium alter-6D02]